MQTQVDPWRHGGRGSHVTRRPRACARGFYQPHSPADWRRTDPPEMWNG